MKINIMYDFKDTPWGGGNQFLKALKGQLTGIGVYEPNPVAADIILYNSFQHNDFFRKTLNLKKRYPQKIFVHRMDGPISKIRGKDYEIDKLIYHFNYIISDATVFQSEWTKKENRALGLAENRYETVISNAPDPAIFNTEGRIAAAGRKTRLIAASWSSNMRKGFDFYKYLDENLDFGRYEMTFAGNSPFEFRNIRWIKALASKELAAQFRSHDIFITASQNDPCSNSLIEAMHCGLPAVVLNDGGHPEIIGSGGRTFSDNAGLLAAIEDVAAHYETYRQNIALPGIKDAGRAYYDFMENIYRDIQAKSYQPKYLSVKDYLLTMYNLLLFKAY